MTHIIFFEKPGCGGNARQRAALLEAGHTLDLRNLLSTAWTPETLLVFLGELPVADWFNRAAPRVKNGEINPEMLDADAALHLLLTDPLLIRRPLMQRCDTGTCHVGFDVAAVNAWIGLGTKSASAVTMEGCISPTERCASPS
jgi:nitrogenase-associated protein